MSTDEIIELEDNLVLEHRKKLEEKYKAHKLSLTGHVVIVGSLLNIRKSILFLGNERYEFNGTNSALMAMQANFKAISVLGKDFPKAASAAWEYIKVTVYGIPVPGKLLTTTEFHGFLRTKKTVVKSRKRKSDQ